MYVLYTEPIFSGDEIHSHVCMHSLQWLASGLVSELFTGDAMGDTEDVLFVSNVSAINAFVSEMVFAESELWLTSAIVSIAWFQ